MEKKKNNINLRWKWTKPTLFHWFIYIGMMISLKMLWANPLQPLFRSAVITVTVFPIFAFFFLHFVDKKEKKPLSSNGKANKTK